MPAESPDPRVVGRPDGTYQVVLGSDVLATCDTNAEAWAWIDRYSDEGRTDRDRFQRIGDAFAAR